MTQTRSQAHKFTAHSTHTHIHTHAQTHIYTPCVPGPISSAYIDAFGSPGVGGGGGSGSLELKESTMKPVRYKVRDLVNIFEPKKSTMKPVRFRVWVLVDI
jgi:hypothetical protein